MAGSRMADASAADGGGLIGDASSDAAADVAGRVCALVASKYDQSCATNTDCVIVRLGDYCDPMLCYNAGTYDAIHTTALAQFDADVAKTPIGSGAVQPPTNCSGLGSTDYPEGCCVAGKCQFSPVTCPSDTVAACSQAGGACSRHVAPVRECGSAGQAPPGSCAQPDETCCLSELDAATVDSPFGTLDFTVLCLADAGPVDGGTPPADNGDIPGVGRWCNGSEICTSFNGGWQCCIVGPSPISMCVAP
jgi:hypothetical protein